MPGPSLKTCPSCGHAWEEAASAAAPRCPRCGKVNTAANEKTPPRGMPAVPAKPATAAAASPAPAAPRKPAVSNRPVSTPKKSHFVRNLVAIVIGLVGAAIGLHFAGLLKIPSVVWEPAEKAAARAKAAVATPKEEKKKPVEKPPEEKKPEKRPEEKPPEPKPPPPEPDPDFSKEKAYDVVKVEDGSTIVVKGDTKNITVHLLGIAVPKPGEGAVHGMRDGSEARDWVKAWLKGQKIYLYYGILDSPKWRAERDSLGSDRAWVFRARDGAFLNLELVKEGFGRSSPKDGKEFEELLNYWDDKAKDKRP